MNGSKACYWLDRAAVFRKHALTARTHSTLILTLSLNPNPNILIIICCFVFFNVSARLYSFSVTCRCFFEVFFFLLFVWVFFFFRFRGLLIVLFDFDIFYTHLMHRDIVNLVTEIFAFCILLMNVYWDCLLFEMWTITVYYLL